MKQQQQENVVHSSPIGSSGTRVDDAPHTRILVSSHAKCDNSSGESLADLTNRKKDTARELIQLIRAGNIEHLQDMLRSSKPDLNVMVNGQTALHYCLLLGRDISWLKQLIANGANPNLSTRDGWHPIHLAAIRKNHEILTYLITCNTRALI